MESKGLQGRVPTYADITTANLSRGKATGERAYMHSSHTTAEGTARAEGPPSTWHVIMSDTQ